MTPTIPRPALCPVTTELLKGIPNIKAAMFASLPPGSRLPRHRDPYAGSLRFHMGLITPNSPDCYINVDGETYYWRDGEAVVFDETSSTTPRTRRIRTGSSCSPTSSVRCAFAGPRPSTA